MALALLQLLFSVTFYSLLGVSDLAIWLEVSISTLEKLWRMLKELCQRGALDTEKLKCEYNSIAEAIEFKEKGK